MWIVKKKKVTKKKKVIIIVILVQKGQHYLGKFIVTTMYRVFLLKPLFPLCILCDLSGK